MSECQQIFSWLSSVLQEIEKLDTKLFTQTIMEFLEQDIKSFNIMLLARKGVESFFYVNIKIKCLLLLDQNNTHQALDPMVQFNLLLIATGDAKAIYPAV